jgi:hypothetical protein
MRKLRLQVDELVVESFLTQPELKAPGTVRGAQETEDPTAVCNASCGTCYNDCGPDEQNTWDCPWPPFTNASCGTCGPTCGCTYTCSCL